MATAEVPQSVQKLAERVRHKVEGRTGPSEEYLVVAYRVEKVGPGIYTSFKIRTDNQRYVHAEVYQSSEHEEPALTGLERSRAAWDPLISFVEVIMSSGIQTPETVQRLAEKVRPKVEGRTGPLEEYVVVQHKIEKIGSGVYTLLKIRGDKQRYVHVEVYQSSEDGEPEVTGLERSRAAMDPLTNVVCDVACL